MHRQIFILWEFTLLFISPVFGQTNHCPDNIGFETGTLKDWQTYIGSCCPIDARTKGTSPGMFVITSGSGTDPYGKFPVVPPGGGKYALRLGNEKNAAKSERVRLYFRVPDGVDNYCFNYKYAFVYRDRLDHTIDVQPRFEVKVTDSASGSLINCGHQLHIPYWYHPGIRMADTGYLVYYKPWTDGTINLSGCAGKTVAIDFATAGCDEGGHFGYAYFDLSCGKYEIKATACREKTKAVLYAPKGYYSYDWRDSSMQQIVIGKGDSLLVPTPARQARFFVIIKPFDGATCIDTLSALVKTTELRAGYSFMDSIQCLDNNRFVFTNLSWTNKDSLRFLWDFGDSGTSDARSPVKAYKVPGKFKVQMIAISPENCRDTFHSMTGVIDRPQSHYKVNDTAQCLSGNLFMFEADSGPGRKYLWYLGNGDSGSTEKWSYSYLAPGYYIITLIANDLGVCADTISGQVEVFPQADLFFPADTVCLGQAAGLQAVSKSFTGKIDTYEWSMGDQSILNGNPVKHFYNKAGSFSIKLKTITDKGCIDSLAIPDNVVVHDLPSAGFSFSKILDSFPVTIMQFQDHSFGSGRMKYSWQFGDDGKSSLQSPGFSFDDTGIFRVSLLVEDSFGCTDEIEKWIRVDHGFSLFVPNVFSPNSDAVNEVFRPVGLPNLKSYEMSIYNTWGEKLFVSNEWLNGWDGTYKGAPCPQGIYLCIIQARSSGNEWYTYSLQITLLR